MNLTLRVMPIKKYVKLTYLPVNGLETIAESIRTHCGALNSDPDFTPPTFMEVTLFSPNQGVITLADFGTYAYVCVRMCGTLGLVWVTYGSPLGHL